mmetsp:Transcript_32022/g.77803  ORF Transcript_32022/g.77803 Transcript_32022/m.77803 type:complete len:119 (+) Transcript_32022:117-473(+)
MNANLRVRVPDVHVFHFKSIRSEHLSPKITAFDDIGPETTKLYSKFVRFPAAKALLLHFEEALANRLAGAIVVGSHWRSNNMLILILNHTWFHVRFRLYWTCLTKVLVFPAMVVTPAS